MNKKQKKEIKKVIKKNGFDYAFLLYSEYADIKDDKFHKARKRYINSVYKLKEILD